MEGELENELRMKGVEKQRFEMRFKEYMEHQEQIANENVERTLRLLQDLRIWETRSNQLERRSSVQENHISKLQMMRNDLLGLTDKISRENKQLKQKLDELQDYTQNINALNVSQLNILKQRFEYKLSKIERAKEKMFENKVLCMICMVNHKNILIRGCNH